MKMMTEQPVKLYVSGPMTGIADFNYPLFNEVATQFRKEGLTVYSPAEIDDGMQIGADASEAKPWQYYMTRAIAMQMESNAWAGLPGWTRSKGAKREFDLAVDLHHRLYLVRRTRVGNPPGIWTYYLDEIELA